MYLKKDLLNSTYFTIDYRSPPTGIGSINFENGDEILVTELDSGPKDMEEAKKYIKEEYWPTAVNHIPFNMGQYWKEGQAALNAILYTHKVKYVIDSELAYECKELVENLDHHVFTLENWIKARII